MKRYKLDLMLSVFVILFSLILIIFVIPKQIRVPDDLKGTYLSPSALPSGYSIFLLIVGVVLLISTIFSKKLLEEKEKTVDIDKKIKKESFLITIKLWVIFFIFMILLPYLGMLVSSILFMFFTILYFGNSSKKMAISVSVIVPGLLYVFFRFLAGVPLPNGFLLDYFF